MQQSKEKYIKKLDYIIFDGDCYLCRTSMDVVSAHMESAVTIPFQKVRRFNRVSEKGMIVSAGQSVWIGAEAVLQIGLRMNGWIKFLAILFSLPILKDCFGIAYALITRYRKDIPKDIVQSGLKFLHKLV